MNKKVFISYSHRDKDFVGKLGSDLASRGIDVWVDVDKIRIGDSLREEISKGISEADYVLIIISNASLGSKWLQYEIQAAFEKDPADARRVLIPVVIEKVEMPIFLSHIKYADFTQSYESGLDEIVRAILELPTPQASTPPQLINVRDFVKEVASEVAQILKVNPQGIRVDSNLPKSSDPKLVFVIMSFSPDMEPIFEGVKAAGETHGLQVERVKDVIGDYRITSKIIEMIHKARIIVADLTHERPNVYFELGYARGLQKTIISTAREGTNLHFDVQDWTCTFYNDSRVLEKHLRERFAFELGKT